MTFKTIKELGQNFLQNQETADIMVKLAYNDKVSTIIEIGPGAGALTTLIEDKLTASQKLIAVELDERCVVQLRNTFTKDNVLITHANILDWLPTFNENNFNLIGSLPYYITSPILHAIIRMKTRPGTVVLLVQDEVAKKICAQAPDASYLSTFMNTFYNTKYIKKVGRVEFNPVPKVDSAILEMTLKESLVPYEHIHAFEGFLHKGFITPRKMINKIFTKEKLTKWNINPSARPQEIQTEKWVEMFNSQ